MEKVKLSNGVLMPIIGLGTWQSPKEDAYNAVTSALKAGYRHIDTAFIYGNEDAVGNAINDSNIKREEIFLTTKLWNTSQGYEQTKKAIETSLKSLNQDYVDLYLIHWFKGYEQALESWKAIEEAYENGKIRAIGVSNYNVHHLMYLLENAKIKPMVNQIETHVELQNDFIQDFCKKNNIQLEAYAPLMSWKVKEMIEKEELKAIAKAHNKTVPQIAIKWLNQRGIVALPKSVNESRIIANFDVNDFKLSNEEMAQIKTLNKGNKLFPEFDNVVF
jgi:diketogulonate reductase-like aldo/keto reductase